MAECGSLRTTAAPGTRSLMDSRRSLLARLRYLHRIPKLFMLRAAKGYSGPTCRSEMESTSQRMRERPGCILGCEMESRFPPLRSTHKIRIGSSPRYLGILMVEIWSGEFFVQPMEAAPGRRCSTKTKTPADPMLKLIHQTRM